MPNKIVKNKKQYMLGGQGALNSQAGDKTALEALYTSTNGGSWADNTGWASSGMDLSNTIYGVTTATIDGELRVTELNLEDNNLTGNIEVPEIENLKEMTYFNVFFNSLNSGLPQELFDLTTLEYLYLSRSDDVLPKGEDPHEEAATGGGDVHAGKNKGSENNVFTGAVPAPSNPSAMNLKWISLNWTDTHITDNVDGISSISPDLFKITTFEGLHIYRNQNVADLTLPDMNMPNLTHWSLGGDYVIGDISDALSSFSSIRYIRLSGSDRLTLNFDQVNWANLTTLEALYTRFTDMTGTEVPNEFYDGTMPDLYQVSASFPSDDIGIQGSFPEVASGLNGGSGHNIVKYRRNKITDLPASFWNNNPNIIQLDFTLNNLTTIGTNDLSNQTSLRYLRLSNNELHEKMPYLSWNYTMGGDIELDNNRYVFKHMLYVPPNAPNGETNLELLDGATSGTFVYHDQKPAGTTNTYTTTDSNGDIVINDFDSIYEHVDNNYQWQKSTDGGSSWSDITGATSKTYTITGATNSDNGIYRVQVTNSKEAGLAVGSVNNITLTSKEITVSL